MVALSQLPMALSHLQAPLVDTFTGRLLPVHDQGPGQIGIVSDEATRTATTCFYARIIRAY